MIVEVYSRSRSKIDFPKRDTVVEVDNRYRLTCISLIWSLWFVTHNPAFQRFNGRHLTGIPRAKWHLCKLSRMQTKNNSKWHTIATPCNSNVSHWRNQKLTNITETASGDKCRFGGFLNEHQHPTNPGAIRGAFQSQVDLRPICCLSHVLSIQALSALDICKSSTTWFCLSLSPYYWFGYRWLLPRQFLSPHPHTTPLCVLPKKFPSPTRIAPATILPTTRLLPPSNQRKAVIRKTVIRSAWWWETPSTGTKCSRSDFECRLWEWLEGREKNFNNVIIFWQ